MRKDIAPSGSDSVHLARVKDRSRGKSQEVERVEAGSLVRGLALDLGVCGVLGWGVERAGVYFGEFSLVPMGLGS